MLEKDLYLKRLYQFDLFLQKLKHILHWKSLRKYQYTWDSEQ